MKEQLVKEEHYECIFSFLLRLHFSLQSNSFGFFIIHFGLNPFWQNKKLVQKSTTEEINKTLTEEI